MNCARLGHTYQLAHPLTLQIGNCSTLTSRRWRVCGLCPSSPVTGRPVCCRPARSITRTVSLQCPVTLGHLSNDDRIHGDVMVEDVQFCSCDDHCLDGEMWSKQQQTTERCVHVATAAAAAYHASCSFVTHFLLWSNAAIYLLINIHKIPTQ